GELVKANFDGVPVPEVDEDYKIGNLHGAMRSFTGKSKDGKPLYIRVALMTIRHVLYELLIVAHDKAEKEHRDAIKAAIAGLVWDDATEGVRGPWASPIPATTMARKDSSELGKDSPIIAAGLNGTKPAALG